MAKKFICDVVRPAQQCLVCKASFVTTLRQGPKTKYCSADCKPRSIPRTRIFDCSFCSRPFESRQSKASICSAKCKSANLSNKISLAAAVRGPPHHRRRVCLSCSSPFVMRNRSGKARSGIANEGRYCSRQCASDSVRKYESANDAKRASNARRRIRKLGLYGTPFDAICTRCDARFVRLKQEKKCARCVLETAKSTPKVYASCAICGDAIPMGRQKYCSRKCSHRAISLRAKARERSLSSRDDYEQVVPIKVFERDGWRCHICRCITDRSKLGSIRHPRAPTVDHLLPVQGVVARTMPMSRVRVVAATMSSLRIQWVR